MFFNLFNKNKMDGKQALNSRYTIKDAAYRLECFVFASDDFMSAVNKFSQVPNIGVVMKNYNKKSLVEEIILFLDFYLSVALQFASKKLGKENLGKNIWDEYCTLLMAKMGKEDYEKHVEMAAQRKDVYSKIKNQQEADIYLTSIFCGFALDGKPRYLMTEFEPENLPNFFFCLALKSYLDLYSKHLETICQEILGSTA